MAIEPFGIFQICFYLSDEETYGLASNTVRMQYDCRAS